MDMNRQAELSELGHRVYMPNYKPRNVVIEDGLGCRVRDVNGQEYIDFGSGIGVNCLGHRDAEIVDAVTAQANRLWHTSNVYFSESPIRLANALTSATFADRVFFCNSGAEANEAAIKIVRKFAAERFPDDKRTILTFDGSFHGRTLATITATAQPKYQQDFGPLPEGFRYCPFNDVEKLKEAFSSDLCAVLIEPIQGEGGIRPATDEFLRTIQELCRENHALLVFDEIQCGMGRTGRLFAHEWVEGLTPDIVTIAKAFGAGLPIGATLAGPKVSEVLSYGSHGSTFGGNPICCAVANVVLRRVTDHNFLASVGEQGEYLRQQLVAINERTGLFAEIRGKGLMIGAHLNDSCGFTASDVVDKCCELGLLILQAGPQVVRLLPALTIEKSDIRAGLEILETALLDLSR